MGGSSGRPLGLAVVGDLVVSQVLTLYVTPVIYIYMEQFTTWLQRRRTEPVAVVDGGGEVVAK
jgi:Cu/Ag efflux pump CusA